nr:Ybt1 [Starmerella bombicola]
MKPLANSTDPWNACPGKFWNYDDFENCHRQRYLEFYPLVTLLTVAAIYTVYSVTSYLVRKPDSKFSFQDPSITVFHPENIPDTNAKITLRTRSINDRLRLAAELALNTVQTALVFALLRSDEYITHYDQYAPKVPILQIILSLHSLLLSIYRFRAASQIQPLVASPFSQQAYIYTIMVTVFGLNFYSQFSSSYSSLVSRLTTLALLVSSINWLILFSSPIGDSVPRLYTTKGAHVSSTMPSTEQTSSLLTAMSCSWCFDMLRTAQKNPLEADDVPDLVEDDHVYEFLRRSQLLPKRWSFFTRLAVTLRKPISLNIFYGCSASFLKLTPTLLIKKILEYLETRSVPVHVAWLYVFALGFTYLLSNISSNQAYYQGRKLSLGIRSLIIGNVYRKAMFQRTAKAKPNSRKKTPDVSTASSSSDDQHEGSSDGRDGGEDEEDSRVFDVSNTGAVINLMSVDAFKVADFAAYLHEVPSTPLLVILSIVFLYSIIGWSAFVSIATMLAITPLNIYLARKLNKVQDELMAVTDRRIEKTNELIDAIRIVKFYAWERRFSENVLKIRDEELHLLLWRYNFWIMNGFLFFVIPILVVITSFWCFVRYQGGQLTTSIAFTALAIFNIMRMPLSELAYIFTDFSSAIVSLGRVQQYLNADETPKYDQLEKSPDNSPEILGFENASFSWAFPSSSSKASGDAEQDEAFKLRNLNIKFVLEDLNVIVGHTGSGKSSLLLALLGEMRKECGHVYLPEENRRTAQVDEETGLTNTIAYCPQEAWLVNETIKNNIIFAHAFDRKRYDQVLDACELRRDLEILEKGDQTLIGDKGIALSGGQKQRVSLARAIYSNSRHLIFDDCLSAVDSHTAEALYNNALTGNLAKNRTIILVSHNVALTIGKAAQVVVLKNGKVVAQGPPNEVSASGHLGDDELISRTAQSAVASRVQSETDLTTMNKVLVESERPDPAAPHTQIIEEEVEDATHEEEARAVGSVPLRSYLNFLQELANKKGIAAAILLAVLVPLIEYLESWWVKLWAASSGDEPDVMLYRAVKNAINPHLSMEFHFPSIHFGHHDVDEDVLRNLRFYSAGYALIGLAGIVAALLREYIIYQGGLRAARKIFRRLLTAVVHARTRFYDSTPSGRIVNRFSKDMEVIDQEISANILWLLISVLDALQVTFVVSYVTPFLIPLAVIIVYLFVLIGKAYLAAARELKRLESVSRSPIFQQFGETLSGSVVIRAYGDTERFIFSNWKHVDATHRPYFWLWVANRWLSFWCSILSLMVCVLAATFIVASAEHIDPGMAGISLSFSTYFGDCILWVVRMYATCEISMNSVERVSEYLEIEQEGPAIIPESRPPVGWPSKGNIEFKSLSLRYTEELPLVIKDVSFKVPGGKKVGIVGRTGAGKSTIITALLRMLEPSSGSVVIDDVDISTIGLEDLRTGLSIIPQDPTLFKGTLRSNIDLFNEYSDDKIFAALAHAHLVPENTTAASAEAALQAHAESLVSENFNPFYELTKPVTEGGKNLSQGQRQLLCLSRAILKEPRILLLDEATASIDYDTDALIQETIRNSFSESTILTIAHRLRTIADYDLILVLEAGEVAQFDHPYNLLQDKEGIFYKMCEKSGELDSLIRLARQSKDVKV